MLVNYGNSASLALKPCWGFKDRSNLPLPLYNRRDFSKWKKKFKKLALIQPLLSSFSTISAQ